MASFNHYLSVKDKLCIYYEGYSPEYIVQLRLLRRSIEKSMPGVSLVCACRPEHLIYDPSNLTLDQLREHKKGFGCAILLVYDAHTETNPVWQMVRQLKIEPYPVGKSNSHYGIICPEGNFPTPCMQPKQIDHLRNWINGRGFKPLVVGTSFNETGLPIDKRPSPQERRELARTAGFVVGVECDMLYEAVEAGIPTAMVPLGCQELYESLCEKPIILGV